jgi:hypothetical protein
MLRIVSGDILHVEQLTKDHFDESGKVYSMTERFYAERRNELVLNFEETPNSLKLRTQKIEEDSGECGIKPEWKQNKITLKLASNKAHTFEQLKYILSILIGIPSRRIRMYLNTYCKPLPYNQVMPRTLLVTLTGVYSKILMPPLALFCRNLRGLQLI